MHFLLLLSALGFFPSVHFYNYGIHPWWSGLPRETLPSSGLEPSSTLPCVSCWVLTAFPFVCFFTSALG